MAKKQLTIEEKLQAALVPVEEQPYKVPENWCWVKFSVTYDNVSSSKNKIKQKDYQNEGKFAIVDQGENLIGGYSNNEGIVYDGELPVIIFGDHTRRIKYVDFPFIQGADGVKVLQPKNYIVPRYYFFCLQSMQIPHMGYRRHFPILNKMGFPIAPIAEQSRIVARIEALFAKLDEAKEKIQEVLDGADLRRAAILHQAFTGKLTEKWRREKGVSDDSWKETNLQNVCLTKITDGTHKTPKYTTKEEGGVPFISAKDVTQGEICWDNIKYIIPELHEELYARLAPQRNDILLAKNGTTGVAAIVDTDKVFDLYVTLAVLRPNTDIIYPRYLLHIVNSPICKRQFDERLKGIGVPNLHLRDIKEVIIKIPFVPEQQEIVRLLDTLLSREQSTVTACEEALTTIDTLKKSILARAFRGELGTNDPTESSAKELLQEILAS